MNFPLTYIEHRPPADIAPWIACFWQIVGRADLGSSLLHRVLPDGCADLLFDIGEARRGGSTPAEIVGPMTAAGVVELPCTTDVVGLRLRPGAIGAFTGVPAVALLNSSVPLSALRQTLKISMQQLIDCEAIEARLALLTRACRERIATLHTPDPLIGYTLAHWSRAESAPLKPISVLTRDIGLSERAFERRFAAQVGLTPVCYRRISRFRAVLRLHAKGSHDWSALAAATGFSDQPHLVRDFRAFAGLTPTAWAAAQSRRAGFLQDGKITTL